MTVLLTAVRWLKRCPPCGLKTPSHSSTTVGGVEAAGVGGEQDADDDDRLLMRRPMAPGYIPSTSTSQRSTGSYFGKSVPGIFSFPRGAQPPEAKRTPLGTNAAARTYPYGPANP